MKKEKKVLRKITAIITEENFKKLEELKEYFNSQENGSYNISNVVTLSIKKLYSETFNKEN
jgi:arginine repressor